MPPEHNLEHLPRALGVCVDTGVSVNTGVCKFLSEWVWRNKGCGVATSCPWISFGSSKVTWAQGNVSTAGFPLSNV